MPDVTLDDSKLERIVSNVLRDEGKLLPEMANRLAAMCRDRVSASMTTPSAPLLSGLRVIRRFPYHDTREAAEERFKAMGIDARRSVLCWETVYDNGKPLPPVIADAGRY